MEPNSDQRQCRMTSLVFNKDNLLQVRKAITDTLDIFYNLLDDELMHKQCFSHRDVKERLQQMDSAQWEDIRKLFLDDPYHGYSEGNFTDNELQDVSKLVLDFIKQVDACQNTICKQLENYDKLLSKTRLEKQELQGGLNDARQASMALTQDNHNQRTASRLAASKTEYLEEIVREKTERISQLSRENNIQLWAKEKERLLKDADERQRNLETELSRVKEENIFIKERMTKRLAFAEEQNKMMKLKHEMHYNEDGDVESLKQRIYLQGKDILHIEQELYSQQKYVVGILAGLQKDFGPIKEDCLHGFHRLSVVYDAAVGGRLGTIRKGLPEQYHALPRNITKIPVTRVSAPRPSLSVSPLPFIYAEPPNLSAANSSPSITDSLHQEASINETYENPMIVDPEKHRICPMAAMKYFPHMSQSSIMEHWSLFCEYDSSGDYSLDLPEVVEALSSIVGGKFTAQQIKDAITEVDLDKSETVDFYEYLNVVRMLNDKTGKSELFQTGVMKTSSRAIAKTCIVQ